MEWIDCKEQPPPDATDVLCYRGDGLPPIVAGNFYGLMHTEETGNEVTGTVTHWMPLPKAPNATELSRATLAQDKTDAA